MPKAQTVTVKARGLYDSGNNPWTLPDGALLEALNVVVARNNEVTPRLGLETISPGDYSTWVGRFGDAFVMAGTTMLRYSTDDGLTWTTVGTPPTAISGSEGLRGAEAARSLFLAGSTGISALDALGGSLVAAGVTPALDLAATLAGVGTAIPNATQVAYRCVFGKRDANGRVILGAPSSRIVLSNSAGSTQNATVVVTLPSEVQSSSFFVQLYRTGASVDVNTDPGDEMCLVYEAALSAVSTVTITDSTPDGLGGAALYTNPSQETILNGNERPPLAYDLAEFGGAMWYADVTFPARANINLLGVSGTNGLALNDTITINAQVFTAKAAENVAAREFLLATAGTVDQNVRATVASLIKCINRTAAANAFAVDISEPYPAGIPGSISIQRTDKTNNLTLAVSRATAWANIVATTTPKRDKNGLVYSKPGQPDCIPTAIASAPIRVGSAFEPVKRIVATRNALWVLKADGVWRVTGDAGQFDVQSFDPTVVVLFSSSAVALDNKVYALSDQGFVRISDSGVELISQPITGDLDYNRTSGEIYQGAYAVAHEPDQTYIVYMPANAQARTLVFNAQTDAWSEWGSPANVVLSGAVNPETKRMVVATGGTTYLRQQRPVDLVVYSDKVGTVTFSGAPVNIGTNRYSITYSAATASPLAGDLILNPYGATGIYVSSLTSPNRWVLSDLTDTVSSWGGGVSQVSRAFTATITQAVKCPTPGTSCEWQEAVLLFGTVNGGTATVTLTGDSGSDAAITVTKPTGNVKQVRIWPGRTSGYSGTMKMRYSESVLYTKIPTTLSGVVWTLVPDGDGVSR